MFQKSEGLTFIEVLISTLILSIGVLGVTALQISGLTANRGALIRVEANQLCSDLMDRIESNPGTVYGPVDFGDPPPSSASDCTTLNCTPAQMVEYDLAEWLCSISSTQTDGTTYSICTTLGVTGNMPSGQGSVAVVGGEYVIQVQWVDTRTSTLQLVGLVP